MNAGDAILALWSTWDFFSSSSPSVLQPNSSHRSGASCLSPRTVANSVQFHASWKLFKSFPYIELLLRIDFKMLHLTCIYRCFWFFFFFFCLMLTEQPPYVGNPRAQYVCMLSIVIHTRFNNMKLRFVCTMLGLKYWRWFVTSRSWKLLGCLCKVQITGFPPKLFA